MGHGSSGDLRSIGQRYSRGCERLNFVVGEVVETSVVTRRELPGLRQMPQARDDAILRLSLLRRRPSQGRGVRAVIDILKAFESLLGEIQEEDITIECIADRAQVQVGSVYFFFRDKLSIGFSLIELTLLELAAEFDFTERELSTPVMPFLERLDRKLDRVWNDHRAMLNLFFAYKAHPSIQGILSETLGYVDSQLGRKLSLEFPRLNKNRCKSVTLVVRCHIMHGLDVAAEIPSPQSGRFHREWWRMLGLYVEHLQVSGSE